MKIALIEDRIERMERFSEFDIKKEDIIDIITNTEFNNLINDLDQLETASLEKYNCVISHRSALNNSQRDIIKEYCKKKKKPLVFFSGGISSSIYYDSAFPYLNINSKEFYSGKLKMFIDVAKNQEQINLLLLQFGIRWKLSLLLSIRDNLNLRTHLKNIRRVRDLEINSLIKNELSAKFNLEWLHDNEINDITIEQVNQFKIKLNELIIESI